MRTRIPFHKSPIMNHTLGGIGSTYGEVSDDDFSFTLDDDGSVAHVVGGQLVRDDVTSPAIRDAVRYMSPAIVQDAASKSDGSYGSFINNLISIVPQVMQYDAQRQLMLVNLDRAKKGQPPIDASKYTPGVQVGVTSDTQKMVLYGLGIVAGAMILSSLARR